MFDENARRLNRQTDARTNERCERLPLSPPDLVGLNELRARWADMPMIPRIVHDRSEGIDNSWFGFDIRTILVGEESAGRFTFHDVIVAPEAALPAHHLADCDTYLYMLDGELELTVGDRTEITRKDGFAYVPQNVTQALRNRSGEPARLFLWHSPAGPERAFAAAHKLWLGQPDADVEALLNALTSLGYSFHPNGERLENDGRINARVERSTARIDTFEDFAELRRTWSRSNPVPKLVHDRNQTLDIPMVGQDTKVLLTGEEGSGRCVVMHYGLAPGFEAAAHHQPSEEEIFLVLEGTLDLTAGNTTTQLTRGGFGFVPRYGTHRFSNPMKEGITRTITLNSPAGHERGFEMIVSEGQSEKFPDLLVAHGWHLH